MVRHKLYNCIVKTYAMLNTCSEVKFSKKKLLSCLGTQGWKTLVRKILKP